VVHANPEIYLGNDISLCFQGDNITLQNIILQPTNTNSYLWSTGDTTAIIQVASPGLYSLTQKSEPLGCTGYGSIDIAKDCFIDVPNADGVNDYFFPRKWLSKGVEHFHLQIFNRWGQLVYETSNKEGLGWDGKLNGVVQPMGVYMYRMEVSFDNGTQAYYDGNVTLVR
jgi:gliding motility-associated-like protein